jgi:hypothetical protein
MSRPEDEKYSADNANEDDDIQIVYDKNEGGRD